MPWVEARQASVPITSSASTPGTSSTFQPSRRTTSWMGSTWLRRSSGMGERLRLVLGVKGVAEGRPLGVEHAGGEVGAHVPAQLLHHVDHAAYGARGAGWPGRPGWRASRAWRGRRDTGSWSRPPAAAFFCRYSWGLIVGDIGTDPAGGRRKRPAPAGRRVISPTPAAPLLRQAGLCRPPPAGLQCKHDHAFRLLIAAAAALPLAAAMAQAPAQNAAPPARMRRPRRPRRAGPTRPSSAYAPRMPAPASTSCAWAAKPSRSSCSPRPAARPMRSSRPKAPEAAHRGRPATTPTVRACGTC